MPLPSIRTSFLASFLLCICTSVQADIIFESATKLDSVNPTFGSPGTSGTAVTDRFYSGAIFELTETTETISIGGNFRGASNDIFGALVSIETVDDSFQSPDFASSDVLATTVFAPPLGVIGDASGALSVTLQPGTYGIFFGNGLFGTTATSNSAQAVVTIGSPPQLANGAPQVATYVYRVSDEALLNAGTGARFFLEGNAVPEPSGIAILSLLAGTQLLRRARPSLQRSRR